MSSIFPISKRHSDKHEFQLLLITTRCPLIPELFQNRIKLNIHRRAIDFFELKPHNITGSRYSNYYEKGTLTAAAKNVLSPISDTNVIASDFVKPYKNHSINQSKTHINDP